ncbi:MAG: hypothetical protein COB78_04425 [Hyphomicrobiales bacterium]|nr:MAG: hypothetical protein COB78_04425 [Hyphomicrobiales bacterium]
MAKNLANLQSQMQNDILKRESRVLKRFSVPKHTTAEKRFAVYQDAYQIRLIEVLSEDYENTWKYLGDEQFYKLAVEYIKAHPSDQTNMRWFGRHFPEFLTQCSLSSDHPILTEIASIEKAIEDAFDAVDDQTATMENLAAIPPEAITGLTFKLKSACRLLRQQTNALDIYMALVNEQTPDALESFDQPRHTLVWRNDMMCQYRALDAEEGMLVDLMFDGKDFALMCEMAATMRDADSAATRVAGHITNWLQTQVISELIIAK